MLEGGVRRQELILFNKSCFGGGGQGIAFNCVEEKLFWSGGGGQGTGFNFEVFRGYGQMMPDEGSGKNCV